MSCGVVLLSCLGTRVSEQGKMKTTTTTCSGRSSEDRGVVAGDARGNLKYGGRWVHVSDARRGGLLCVNCVMANCGSQSLGRLLLCQSWSWPTGQWAWAVSPCGLGGGAYMGHGLHVANPGVAGPVHLDTIWCRGSSWSGKKFSIFLLKKQSIHLL